MYFEFRTMLAASAGAMCLTLPVFAAAPQQNFVAKPAYAPRAIPSGFPNTGNFELGLASGASVDMPA